MADPLPKGRGLAKKDKKQQSKIVVES